VHIDGDHPSRFDCAALFDVLTFERTHAGFRADSQNAVIGDRIPQRTKAIAVKTGNRPLPVISGDGRRAIPRLHNRIAVFVKRTPLGGHHSKPFRPGFRDEQSFRHGRRASGAHEQFEHLIQRAGVRRAGLYHRFDIIAVFIEDFRRHGYFMALHPVDIAFQRVDLAIMRQHSERLC